jgi:thioredoxin-like negative regulator of GroEL
MRLAPLALALALAACSREEPVAQLTPAASPAAAPISGPEQPAAQKLADAAIPAAVPAAQSGIDWRHGDVDAAFAQARSQSKPVFLYWGAVWCPPCNQVKATIFNRADFIERSRAFVAVYLDGDSPSAQKLAERFKVSGYPTMILFRPDGSEITRLPGEVDARQYVEVMTSGMNSGRPIRQTLASAVKGGAGLDASDWRMLAFYSWDTDEQQLLSKKELVPTLNKVAANCPANLADTATRLQLRAMTVQAEDKSAGANASAPAADYDLVMKLLADAAAVREQADILTNYAGELARYLARPDSTQGVALRAAWDAALVHLEHDPGLSQTDRLGAVGARVELARLSVPKGDLPAELVADVKTEVARADHETTDAYERQSVINAGGYALSEAGLLDDSDTLLKAELTRSHSPYYFMVDLAENAKKRGDKAAAIDWLGRAYDAAQGPATRIQWGTRYARGLIELAPDDEKRIVSVTSSVLDEAARTEDALYERNRGSLGRLAKSITQWNAKHQHEHAVRELRAKFDALCRSAQAGSPEQHACHNFFAAPTLAT